MEQEIEFLWLTQNEVKRAGGGDMSLALKSVEEMFRAHGEAKTIVPPKTVLDLDERVRGRINAMPAYVGGDVDICGIKWISGFPANPKKLGLPRGIGLLILNDSWSGVPLAIMDATLISAMRTGAVTGVGAKYLARKDCKVVAMIGCGVQARTQLLALKTALTGLKKVMAYDVWREAAEKYAADMKSELGVDIEVAQNIEKAVVGADIIVTATMADEPLVKNAWVKKGSYFSHVGSYQEEEFDVVLNSDKLVVDDWEQVKHRRTPVLAKMFLGGFVKEDAITELADIILAKKPGRENDSERIFFEAIGMGSADVVFGFRVYKQALKMGLGQKLKLFGS